MEPFSRRRWTAIPAQWVSNSVHEVFFCFSYKCISSLLDLPRGRYGCSSLAFKGLLGSAINWRTRWRLQTILRFTVFHFILRFTVFCAQKEANFIFAKKEKFFGLTNFLGQWKNWPKWNEKGYTPVTPPPPIWSKMMCHITNFVEGWSLGGYTYSWSRACEFEYLGD